MNYIKRLQKENKAKDAKIEALEAGLRSITDYVSGPKFLGGHLHAYVNVNDILLRVHETLEAGQTAEDDALAPEPEPEPTPPAKCSPEVEARSERMIAELKEYEVSNWIRYGAESKQIVPSATVCGHMGCRLRPGHVPGHND